jgi:valyl-tRNA synthetase
MPRDKARAAVLETLGENLVATENIEHQVPLSERSGCIVEPLLTWQWFVDMESMADKALQAIEHENIRFYPSEWANNAKRWLENIQPWCVSRQLWWGHRLPVWYGPNNSIYVAPTETQAYAKAHIDWGTDVVLTQDNDVLDTWFSSGLWPMATLGWPCHEQPGWQERLPTNILVTGFDILFFWVARMMMLGLEMTDRLPFHEVYIHPLIRDAHGQKMSKTKNNVVNPLALIDDYGADAVRFALASATSGKQHMKFAIQNVDNAKHFVTKVTNVFKFARLKGVCTLESFNHEMTWDQWPETIHHPINGWIRNKTAHMLHEWQTHITQYRFSEATLAVYQWVWREVCDVYIEWAKKLLDHPEYAAEVRQTLTCVLGTVLRVLHPIMPFVTDFVWHEWSGSLGDLESMPWPTVAPYNVWMEQCMDDVQRLMTGIRAQRSKESLPKTHLLTHALSDLTLEARQGLMYWQSIVQDWVGVSIIP